MTFRASSGGWGRSPGRMGSSGGSFSDIVASWFTTSNAPGRFDPGFRDWATSGALFQDSAGTTPVTALEQPVGLRLDRSRGLVRGPELWNDAAVIFNGESSRVGPGVYRLYSSAGAYSDVVVPRPGAIGKMFEVAFNIDSITSGFVTGDYTNAPSFNTPGPKVFRAPATTNFVGFKRQGTSDAIISNVTIKEIPGAHRIQPTTTKRPILSGRKNWLGNSALAGGGSTPTGWVFPIGTGTSTPVGTIDGNTIYRQAAVAQRPYYFASGPLLGTSGSIVGTVYVGQVYAGAETLSNCVGWSAVPTGAVLTYWKDGEIVPGNTIVTANSRIGGILTSAGTAGAPQFRIGLGVSANATGDVEFSRPQVETGSVAGRYQRTGLSPQTGDYDAVGFPIGLLYDGVDDGMYTAAPIDYSGTDKVTAVYATRKDTDVTGFLFEHGPGISSTPAALNAYSSAGNFRFELRGDAASATALVATTPAAPWTGVVSCQYDVAGAGRTTEIFPMLNGVVPAVTAGGGNDAGGGLLSAQIDYEASRADSSTRYTGLILGELKWGAATTLAPDRYAYLLAQFAALALEQ